MRRAVSLIALALGLGFVALQGRPSSAAVVDSLICQFEKIATAELDSEGKIVTAGENSSGEIVFSGLDTASPSVAGNLGTSRLRVLKRSKDAIWLVEATASESLVRISGGSLITLFLKTGIVMHTQHEILPLAGHDRPLGFVEVGKCRPLK